MSSTNSSSGGEPPVSKRKSSCHSQTFPKKAKSNEVPKVRKLPKRKVQNKGNGTEDQKRGFHEALTQGPLNEFADTRIDNSVLFENIGGLSGILEGVREMVMLPLIYPDFFQKFNITPPQGVIFHGSPGTGKTLVARALANECAKLETKITFFARKSADCMSMWLGESEHHLRQLFDQAYEQRPSIIFFDELDGLAPARSPRQDQAYSSVVSTLLSLMDGIDNRGEVIVIGATNRLEAIDPALRRPGRFDREFYFPLPSLPARQQILEFHTSKWSPPMDKDDLDAVAHQTIGYSGADLKTLCSEAALLGLREKFPKIYNSTRKQNLNLNEIKIQKKHFLDAMKNMKSSSQRNSSFHSRPLNILIKPLLEKSLQQAIKCIQNIFPVGDDWSTYYEPDVTSSSSAQRTKGMEKDGGDTNDLASERIKSLRNYNVCKKRLSSPKTYASKMKSFPPMFRPRFIICGSSNQGHSTFLAPALLHHMEHLPVYVCDMLSDSSRTTDDGILDIFKKAQHSFPNVLYFPFINEWWNLDGAPKMTFMAQVKTLDPFRPILLLATSSVPFSSLPSELQNFFNVHKKGVFQMTNPTAEEKEHFWRTLSSEVTIFRKITGSVGELVEQTENWHVENIFKLQMLIQNALMCLPSSHSQNQISQLIKKLIEDMNNKND